MSNDHAIRATQAGGLLARPIDFVLCRLERLLTWSLAFVLALMLGVVLLQVLARTTVGNALPWAGEVVQLAISYITFIGGAVGTIEKG